MLHYFKQKNEKLEDYFSKRRKFVEPKFTQTAITEWNSKVSFTLQIRKSKVNQCQCHFHVALSRGSLTIQCCYIVWQNAWKILANCDIDRIRITMASLLKKYVYMTKKDWYKWQNKPLNCSQSSGPMQNAQSHTLIAKHQIARLPKCSLNSYQGQSAVNWPCLT